MKTRNVLIICDNVGATQMISFSQPLEQDVTIGRLNLRLIAHDPAWAEESEARAVIQYNQPDILVLSRYTAPEAQSLISAGRASGAAVIFHLDDDLLRVPRNIGKSKYDHYSQPDRVAALKTALNASDLVYASTPPLASRLAKHGITAPIAAGDIYCSITPEAMRAPLPSTVPVIGYMATGGHGADLELVLPAIEQLLEETPDLRFETFGTIPPPQQLARFGARAAHFKGIPDYSAFLDRLHDLGWWIAIAPLENTPFNRCKADTKWVEYAFCGIPAVVSDLPLYHKACSDGAGVLAADTEQWLTALRRMLIDHRARETTLDLARQRLKKLYDRDLLRRQVNKIFDQAITLAAAR